MRCRPHGVRWPLCRGHGTALVNTYAFDRQAARVAAQYSKTAAAELMRTSWRTAGRIVERFVADRDRAVDRLAGLRRIGTDEISHRKGQRCMKVAVDHDTAKGGGTLVLRAGPFGGRAAG
ncbi:hypothetical protein AQI95_38950 [Streptomyces yokosukanensis]|uniref:Transposase IS204/IS1001/IS1096/IS1165 helix-turn-helix domain-containing protein n=1 Tax=Streptomyces yokosukanensis TaxID=67386 RepID=A0A101NUT6_9ACTN|nr:transposase [Streptomyces yokosukanensis]KUM99497.1 hypothetical protein AQI95_38950 [Streptomyces yokosukanensis]